VLIFLVSEGRVKEIFGHIGQITVGGRDRGGEEVRGPKGEEQWQRRRKRPSQRAKRKTKTTRDDDHTLHESSTDLH
jgi:hypothetical protein